MDMPKLEYEYKSFTKFHCKTYRKLSLGIVLIDYHAPYICLVHNYCSDVYGDQPEELEELPLMPYEVKKLKEIGKYITTIQNRFFNSKDSVEIAYLIEVFSYIQETMELPDGFLDYYDKVQAEEMLKG